MVAMAGIEYQEPVAERLAVAGEALGSQPVLGGVEDRRMRSRGRSSD